MFIALRASFSPLLPAGAAFALMLRFLRAASRFFAEAAFCLALFARGAATVLCSGGQLQASGGFFGFFFATAFATAAAPATGF